MNAIQPSFQGGKIFQAIPAIIAEVSPVGKNAYNQQQKYPYRSADDVCDAVHESLGKHKVFTTCKIVERSVVERESRGGGLLLYVTLKAIYTFHAEDGSFVESEAFGEAMDSGDKATNKAMTAAYKYALIQVFCLMGHEDSEVDSPEPAPQQQQSYPPRKSLPSCPSCGKADSIIQGKSEYGAGLLCYKAKGGCGHSWETAEHPFNENHKGKKKSPPADDGAKPGTGKVDFAEAMRSLDGATPAKRKVWRERILARYGNGDIDLDDMAKLAVEAAKRFEDDAEAQLIHKWLCDICNLGNESRFDAAANELSKQRAELAMA